MFEKQVLESCLIKDDDDDDVVAIYLCACVSSCRDPSSGKR